MVRVDLFCLVFMCCVVFVSVCPMYHALVNVLLCYVVCILFVCYFCLCIYENLLCWQKNCLLHNDTRVQSYNIIINTLMLHIFLTVSITVI